MKEIRVTVEKIKWDVDYDADGEYLPTEMQFGFEVSDDADQWDIDETVSELLSDEVGFCHQGFEITEQIEYE